MSMADPSTPGLPRTWRLRGLLVLVLMTAAGTIWFTNTLLTDRFIETTRNRAELRLASHSGTVMSELQRHSVVPLLLSRDPVLIRSLESNDYTNTSQRLISYVEEIGAASLILLDRAGALLRQPTGSVWANCAPMIRFSSKRHGRPTPSLPRTSPRPGGSISHFPAGWNSRTSFWA